MDETSATVPAAAEAQQTEETTPQLNQEHQTSLPLNESSTDSPENPTGIAAKILAAGRKVFERNGIVYQRNPRGGRIRRDAEGNPLPGKGDVPINAPESALPCNAAPMPSDSSARLDEVLVKRCCSAVIKSVQGFVDRFLFRKARAAGFKPDEAQQMVKDAAITTEESEAFSELAGICLRKHGVGTQYAPEVGLAVIALGVGVRIALVSQTLSEAQRSPQASK